MKLSAIAAVSGSVAAKTAIGRLEASMLETAITISITKIMNVFAPGSTLIGLTRTNIHASPRHRSSRMKRKRHWRIVVLIWASLSRSKRWQVVVITTWMIRIAAVHTAAGMAPVHTVDKR